MPGYTNTRPVSVMHNGVNGANGMYHLSGTSGANGTTSMPSHPAFDSIPDTIAAFARDEFVIVLDSPSRENEGDLIIAASALTPSKAAFMIRHTSGYICAPLPVSRAAALQLPQMVADNADPNRTAYAVSVDAAAPGITTGISAADRALTCRALADPAVDLCRLAGKQPVGVICELITDGEEVPGKAERLGGGMMRRDQCLEFGRRWGIKVCTIEDLVLYLEATEGRLGVEGSDY